MKRQILLVLVLCGLGLCWGLTIPLSRISVLAGYRPLGLIAWQTGLITIFTSLMILKRGTGFPLKRSYLGVFVIIAVVGTLLPNFFSLRAIAGIPAGFMAIIIALVPIFAMPLAIALKLEVWHWRRAIGLLLGAIAVALLIAPSADLSQKFSWVFLAMALVAPFAYGLEANYLSWRNSDSPDATDMLWGASMVAVLVSFPAAYHAGDTINLLHVWRIEDWAILIAGVAHCVAYVGYIWLIGQAGAVFAAQVAYLVTASGLFWSIILLGESYSTFVWLALLLMLAGVALVQPRAEISR